MIDSCDTTDFLYPLQADIYYPIIEQGAYGNLEKKWIFNRTVSCNFSPAGTAYLEEVKPNPKINMDVMLIGRTKNDLRVNSDNSNESIINIILTNIRSSSNDNIYLETSGPRKGKATIFEIASNDPIVGPFGDVEYYKLIIRRSENQASDL